MVFGIVQRHRGSIDIESAVGHGTTFIIRLPFYSADASAQQAAEPSFETVWIPLTETPSPSSPREIKLEGMLYRPPSPGRLPVLVFNHGSTGGGAGGAEVYGVVSIP